MIRSAGPLLRLTAALAPALAAGACGPASAAQDAVSEAFRKQGVEIDAARGLVLVPARVAIRHDLLEYLLVAPHGSVHESLFVTEASPTALNGALLLTGVAAGQNASWVAREPAPTPEELRAGAKPYRLIAPRGDGFLLYVAWRSGSERYFFRAEDLIADLSGERCMRRQSWVYLGSRFVRAGPAKEQAFVAELEGNLVNIALFAEGNTLLTSALPESRSQTNWAANPWLVPATESSVALIFARTPQSSWPEAWTELVPDLPSGAAAGNEGDADLPTKRPDQRKYDDE